MTTLMPIHSAAMCQVDQVRCAIVVGARSLFHSGDARDVVVQLDEVAPLGRRSRSS